METSEYLRDRLHYEVIRGVQGRTVRLDEYQMLQRFRVPRSAVRRALQSLSDAGLVNRARRFGTTPEPPATTFTFGDAISFEASAGPPEMRTESMTILRAPLDIALDLELPEGSNVTLLERSTVAAGARLNHWRIWTPLDVGSTFPEGPPASHTWYQVVHELTGQREFTVERTTMGALVTAEDTELLDANIGETLQFTVRLTRLADGTPVDRSFSRMKYTRMVTNERVVVRV